MPTEMVQKPGVVLGQAPDALRGRPRGRRVRSGSRLSLAESAGAPRKGRGYPWPNPRAPRGRVEATPGRIRGRPAEGSRLPLAESAGAPRELATLDHPVDEPVGQRLLAGEVAVALHVGVDALD